MRALVLLVIVFAFNASYGATITVRQDGSGHYSNIQAAVSASSYSDTILVGPGTYQEHLEIPAGRHLIGDSEPQNTVIDGTDTGRVISSSSIYLENLTIYRGKVYSGAGAGVYGEGTIRNCVILDNHTGRNKYKRSYFAIIINNYSFLDINKSIDFTIFSNFAVI